MSKINIQNSNIGGIATDNAHMTITINFTQLRDFQKLSLREFLEKGDFEKFIEKIKDIFSGLPYTNKPDETYFHIMLYLIFILNFPVVEIRSEEMVSKGRSDLIITLKDKIYIFELKHKKEKQNCEAKLTKAKKQIYEKEYFNKYKIDNLKIFAVAIVFDDKNICAWVCEEVK